MTRLRKLMLDELQRRNYSQNTVRAYIHAIEDFAKYFRRSPDHLGPEHIREYQVHLFRDCKLSAGTIEGRTAALRFLFVKTLIRPYLPDHIPFPKRQRRMPTVLSQEEVGRLIASAQNLMHRTMLMMLYATGLRRAELCHLKVCDIDSERMVVHVRQGKGGRDRDVLLTPKLLDALREYWRWMKPKTYLFPGTVNHWRADVPITAKIVWKAVAEAANSFNNATWTQQGDIPVSPNPNTLACPSGINATAYQCSGGFAPTGLSKDQIRPYLGYSGLNMALGDANSNYNSLQLSLTKRAGFVTGTFAYTYSKALGDGGGAGDAYNENPEPECPFACLVSTAANPVLVNGSTAAVAGGTQTGGVVETWQRFNYGKLSFDATHIVAGSFTVESPWGKSTTGVEGAVVKGWSVSGIVHFQTGAPLTATASQAVGFNGSNIGRRASIVAGQSIGFGGTCSNAKALCWVNPNAFALASSLGAGQAPIGDIIGPNFYQWDLSLRKIFNLPREGMRLQFQADAFNAFNRTNWNNPTVNNAGSSTFGQITGSLPARVLQFGGKFSF